MQIRRTYSPWALHFSLDNWTTSCLCSLCKLVQLSSVVFFFFFGNIRGP